MSREYVALPFRTSKSDRLLRSESVPAPLGFCSQVLTKMEEGVPLASAITYTVSSFRSSPSGGAAKAPVQVTKTKAAVRSRANILLHFIQNSPFSSGNRRLWRK